MCCETREYNLYVSYFCIIHKHKEPFIYRELHRHRIMERLEKCNTNMEIVQIIDL